jgi:hypothetical protein
MKYHDRKADCVFKAVSLAQLNGVIVCLRFSNTTADFDPRFG